MAYKAILGLSEVVVGVLLAVPGFDPQAAFARLSAEEAAAALEPGTSAAVLVWENRWAAPVAAALRRSGGQPAASGRLPVQAILAALDAVEAADR
jgi:hypothetical protein